MSFLQTLASAFKGGSGKVPLARSFYLAVDLRR